MSNLVRIEFVYFVFSIYSREKSGLDLKSQLSIGPNGGLTYRHAVGSLVRSLCAGPFGEHTRIAGHSLASTTSAAQNFHTYVTFDAEFDAGVQICNFLCAYIIKI